MTATHDRASIGNRPLIEVVTELHSRFKNAQSHYVTMRGGLISQLEALKDGEDDDSLKEELSKVNEKINYLRVLSHSLSIADTVLHTEATISEFGVRKGSNT